MIGHIYDGRLIRFCFIADIDGIIVRQFHQNFTGNVARETFFTVRSDISVSVSAMPSFLLILLLHIFAFILINSYLYDCTCFYTLKPCLSINPV